MPCTPDSSPAEIDAIGESVGKHAAGRIRVHADVPAGIDMQAPRKLDRVLTVAAGEAKMNRALFALNDMREQRR